MLDKYKIYEKFSLNQFCVIVLNSRQQTLKIPKKRMMQKC